MTARIKGIKHLVDSGHVKKTASLKNSGIIVHIQKVLMRISWCKHIRLSNTGEDGNNTKCI